MQVVWIGPSVEQAELVRAVLEGQGIRAFVLDRHTLGTLPYLSVGVGQGGARVAVHPTDVEAARAVLEQQPNGAAQLPDDADDVLDVESDQGMPVEMEEAVPDSRLEDLARRAAVTGLFSVFIPPLVLLTLYFLVQVGRLRHRERLAVGPRARSYLRLAVAGIVLGLALAVFYLLVWVRSSPPSAAPPDTMF
jgi:hypothetical protein